LNVGGLKSCIDRPGIAAGGEFSSDQPGTATWICFVMKLKTYAGLYSAQLAAILLLVGVFLLLIKYQFFNQNYLT
jgi:hypothetical protein